MASHATISLGWDSRDRLVGDMDLILVKQLSLLLAPNMGDNAHHLLQAKMSAQKCVLAALDKIWTHLYTLPLSDAFRLCLPFLPPGPRHYLSAAEGTILTNKGRLFPTNEAAEGAAWEATKEALLSNIADFFAVLKKVSIREAAKDPSDGIADRRHDDSWGALYKLPEDLQEDAYHLILVQAFMGQFRRVLAPLAAAVIATIETDHDNTPMQLLLVSLNVRVASRTAGFDRVTMSLMRHQHFYSQDFPVNFSDIDALVQLPFLQKAFRTFLAGFIRLSVSHPTAIHDVVYNLHDHGFYNSLTHLRGQSTVRINAARLIFTFFQVFRENCGRAGNVVLYNLLSRPESEQCYAAQCILRVLMINWAGLPAGHSLTEEASGSADGSSLGTEDDFTGSDESRSQNASHGHVRFQDDEADDESEEYNDNDNDNDDYDDDDSHGFVSQEFDSEYDSDDLVNSQEGEELSRMRRTWVPAQRADRVFVPGTRLVTAEIVADAGASGPASATFVADAALFPWLNGDGYDSDAESNVDWLHRQAQVSNEVNPTGADPFDFRPEITDDNDDNNNENEENNEAQTPFPRGPPPRYPASWDEEAIDMYEHGQGPFRYLPESPDVRPGDRLPPVPRARPDDHHHAGIPGFINATRAAEWVLQDGIVGGRIMVFNAERLSRQRGIARSSLWFNESTPPRAVEALGTPLFDLGARSAYGHALTAAFGTVPPRRVPLPQDMQTYPLFAIRKSLALQLPQLPTPSVSELVRLLVRIDSALREAHPGHRTLLPRDSQGRVCMPRRLSDNALLALTCAYGRQHDVDLRLGIVQYGLSPLMDLTKPPTATTQTVWIYSDASARVTRDGKFLSHRYMALERTEFLGRASHYILAVRQGIFSHWPTGPAQDA